MRLVERTTNREGKKNGMKTMKGGETGFFSNFAPIFSSLRS